MKITKRIVFNLILCSGIFIICLILIALLSGVRHEYKKFKQFLLTLAAIHLIRYIFLQHIEFLIQALTKTLKVPKEVFVNQEASAANYVFNPMKFLKLRMESLKSQLNLPECHKDEELNLKYKLLTDEVWLFGRYFLLLLLLIVNSRNSSSYYNTATIRSVLNENYFSNYKLDRVMNIGDLYGWINDTLIGALNEGYEYDGSRFDEPGWVHFHLAKLLGVVRLQQVRHAKREKSMTRLYFDEQKYFPRWQKLNQSLPYMDKYWRIYYPWLLKQYEGVTNWLMALTHIGSLYSYSENNGYEAFLARDRENSEKILNFLKTNNWLDGQTAAVFIDFTLYNADSNIFTVCSILVEQTPFGNLVFQLNVQSAELLWNMNEISFWWWLLILLYILQMVEFCKVMVVRSWFVSGFFKSRWNCMDFAIVLLNILLLSFAVIREYYVLYVMKTFILSQKLQYVDFRVACVFNYMLTIIFGFLICLASIRIWKILQFSSIFRIFNRTLYTSAVPLCSTVFGIHIFICAVGLSAQILNGSHTEIFSRYLKSMTSIISFSFGFNTRTSPDDLSHGGGLLGFILYLILMFVVAIFLINMFITLICEHFSSAREERDKESPDKLSYWQFLLMEYSSLEQYFRIVFPSSNKESNQSVAESVNKKLDELEEKLQDQQLVENSEREELTDDRIYDEEVKRTNRIRNVADILNLQMEFLERLISVQSLGDSENEDST